MSGRLAQPGLEGQVSPARPMPRWTVHHHRVGARGGRRCGGSGAAGSAAGPRPGELTSSTYGCSPSTSASSRAALTTGSRRRPRRASGVGGGRAVGDSAATTGRSRCGRGAACQPGSRRRLRPGGRGAPKGASTAGRIWSLTFMTRPLVKLGADAVVPLYPTRGPTAAYAVPGVPGAAACHDRRMPRRWTVPYAAGGGRPERRACSRQDWVRLSALAFASCGIRFGDSAPRIPLLPGSHAHSTARRSCSAWCTAACELAREARGVGRCGDGRYVGPAGWLHAPQVPGPRAPSCWRSGVPQALVDTGGVGPTVGHRIHRHRLARLRPRRAPPPAAPRPRGPPPGRSEPG